MIIRKLADTPIMDNAHNVDARNLYNTDDAVISVLTLEPGQSLRPHKTPVDVAFYVLEGEGIVVVGDEKETCTQNTLIESPKDITHTWHNESNALLRILVVKAPKPKKKTIFAA